jgi:DNA-binding transcriptional LysR family regulator
MSNVLDLDLNDLQIFAKVVEARSFTAAGTRLGVPRSTVSRRIAALERRLGVRLLHRTTRKLELTDLGASFYERCAESLQMIAEAEAEMKAAQAAPRGRLRITAPHDLGRYVAPIVAAFVCEHPEVRIEIELSQRIVDLVGEGFDLALRATAHLPDSSLVARKLGGGRARLFASPSYLAERGVPRTPNDLREHDCVVLGLTTTSWRLVCDGHEAIDVPVDGRVRVNDPVFAREAAVAGAGIALLPDFLASEELLQGTLVTVLSGNRGFESMLYLVYPSAKHLSATLRAFRDHLIARFDALPFGGLVPDAKRGRAATGS